MDIEDEYRIVHLDLKGAPPKVSYYEELFPLMKQWGANGLLIEYEDMFPYSGSLQDLAISYAYSVEDIKRIHELALKNDLIIIPLVQTFGHFEFVLKHEKFHALREIPNFPMALCPSKKDSLDVIYEMVDQVLRMHPESRWFHIGADEVYHIGFCAECKAVMASDNVTAAQIFFRHITNVVMYIKKKYPDVAVIMWDDMFRGMDSESLKANASDIGELVEPMVWAYQQDLGLPSGMWDDYSKVFKRIWAASAFKGATGTCMTATDATHHISNQITWLKEIAAHRQKFQNFQGYCLTGWQRYDHYAVLCELLPAGLPSLGFCLQTLLKGEFNEDIHQKVSSSLQSESLVPLNPFENMSLDETVQCRFAGSQVYHGILALLKLKFQYESFLNNDRLTGWMTNYHVKRNYTNPAHIESFLPQGQMLQHSLAQLQQHMWAEMSAIFFEDTAEEWIEVNIAPMLNRITQILDTAIKQISLGALPKSK